MIQYTYPDGTHRWKFFTYGQRVGDDNPPKFQTPDTEGSVHDPGWTVKRKEHENASRAKQAVYDLARSNVDKWDWFVTLTFSPRWVCRSDYQDCYLHVRQLGRELTARGCYWLFVPEHHRDGHSFHFHGLVGGDMPLVYAGRYGPSGRERDTWNLECFPGFTAVQRVTDARRVSTYITKYITKDLVGLVPKGCHRYLRSRNLRKPTVEYLSLLPGEFASLVDWGVYHSSDELQSVLSRDCMYVKEIPIRYTLGNESMFIVENHEEDLIYAAPVQSCGV